MSAMKRWRGLRALVTDAVEHGSIAIERVHKATASKPFDVLEQIPEVAAPARGARAIHDATVSSIYGAVRIVNQLVGTTLDAALTIAEKRESERQGAETAPREREDA